MSRSGPSDEARGGDAVIREGRRSRRFPRLLGLLAGLLLLTLLLPQPRSLAVMSVSDALNRRQSLMAESGLSVKLPGGLSTGKRDWFPKLLCFDAGTGFGSFAGLPGTRLTVLYNFGSYGFAGHSSLFDPASPYYSSFYGAYLVRQPEGAFGFTKEGEPDPAAVALVPEYDFSRLVLFDFGLAPEDFVFDWQLTELSSAVSLAGFDDWTRFTADLRVNGAAHRASGFVPSYLQYGVPMKAVADPFAPADLKGVVYVRYFPAENVSLFLYGLTADEEALAECEKNFLQKARISAE